MMKSPEMIDQQKKTKQLADWVFCIYSEQAKGLAKSEAKMLGAQRTREAYS
jgi:hypothetical protein